MIVSGATTTGLVRAGNIGGHLVAGSLMAHELAGLAVGALAITTLMARHAARQPWRAAMVLAVLAAGWTAARNFAALPGATHATLAAFTSAALLDRTGVPATPMPRRWQAISARLAFFALLAQVAAGSLLRHQLIALPWHLLFGGIAALLLFVAAVPIVQDATRSAAEKRAAKSAIGSLIAQVCLGVSIFVMILLGSANVLAWLSLTAAHVVMGAVTLVAASILVRDHRTTSTAAWSGGSGRS